MIAQASYQILQSLYANHDGISPVINLPLWLNLTPREQLCLSVARLSTYVLADRLSAWQLSHSDTRLAMIQCFNTLGLPGSQIAFLLEEVAALEGSTNEHALAFSPEMIAAFITRITREIELLLPSVGVP